MASRPLLKPFQVITNGDMSADIVSEISIIDNITGVSYAVTWSGSSPVGTCSVEISDDYTENADGSERNPGTWNTMPLSPAPTVSGNTGNGYIDILGTVGYAIRLRYTSTSGTGSMQAIVTGKVS